MKPVYQVDGDGLCLPACIASILEIGVKEVPDFNNYPTRCEDCANKRLHDWLQVRGYDYILIYGDIDNIHFCTTDGYAIVYGPSPRRACWHAIVMKVENGVATMVHDPHPDGTGVKLEGVDRYYIGFVVRKL